jgi:drug/metabolite transporter (DMT)-like permease
MAVPTTSAETLKGVAYIVVSALLLVPFATGAVKYLSASFGVVEIVWVRALGQTAWMLVLFLPRHGFGALRSTRPGLQFVRSTVLFVSTMSFVAGVRHVPLATAHTIHFLSPLMVVALSLPMLGERVELGRWLAVGAGFLGVLIVIRPGSEAMTPAALWILGSAVGWSVVQVLSRRLAADDAPETTAIYTYAVALAATSLAMPFLAEIQVWPSALQWLAILAAGFFGGFRHYFAIKAFHLAPASVITPFNYLELIGATVVGYLIFQDAPDAMTWTGAAVIIASGLYVVRREGR